MDWELAIDRNREALKRILAALVAMAGLGDGACTHLPRRLHRACLRLLRPAESAVRRLVIVVARDMSVTLAPLRCAKPKPRPAILRNGVGTGIVMPLGYRATAPAGKRMPSRLMFPLLDRLPRPARNPSAAASGVPRLSTPGFGAPFPVAARNPPRPDDPIATVRLALRIEALSRALDDLPAEARRFARWRARGADAAGTQDENQARIAASRPAPGPPRRVRRLTPLKPGRPPGSKPKPTHEVHEVLADLNFFAMRALERSDTS